MVLGLREIQNEIKHRPMRFNKCDVIVSYAFGLVLHARSARVSKSGLPVPGSGACLPGERSI